MSMKIKLFALLTAFSLFAVACGGAEEDVVEDVTPVTAATQTTEAPAEEPAEEVVSGRDALLADLRAGRLDLVLAVRRAQYGGRSTKSRSLAKLLSRTEPKSAPNNAPRMRTHRFSTGTINPTRLARSILW